jgi:hypothetical protein
MLTCSGSAESVPRRRRGRRPGHSAQQRPIRPHQARVWELNQGPRAALTARGASAHGDEVASSRPALLELLSDLQNKLLA